MICHVLMEWCFEKGPAQHFTLLKIQRNLNPDDVLVLTLICQKLLIHF